MNDRGFAIVGSAVIVALAIFMGFGAAVIMQRSSMLHQSKLSGQRIARKSHEQLGVSVTRDPDSTEVEVTNTGSVTSVFDRVLVRGDDGLEMYPVASAFEAQTGCFTTPSSTGTVSVDGLDFKPDVIQFTVSNTVPGIDSEGEKQVNNNDQSFGWMHGFAQLREDGTIDQFALSVAGHSNSQNGATGASTDSAAIDITYQRNGSVRGRDRAEVENISADGFTLDFDSVYSGTYAAFDTVVVQFTAYKLWGDAQADIGYFQTPLSPGTKEVTTGFNPDDVTLITSPIIGDIDYEYGARDDPPNNSYGWSKGWFTHDGGVSQQVMSITASAHDIDGHAVAARDDEAVHILYTDGSGWTLKGRTTAHVSSVESDGFTLDFDEVYTGDYNPDDSEDRKLVAYLAFDLPGGVQPEIGYFQTPKDEGEISVSTGFDAGMVRFMGTNTIPDINTEREVPKDPFGWMHGLMDTVDDQQVIHHAAHSDSINGHAYASSSAHSVHILYADQDGNIRGRDVAEVSDVGDSSLTLDFTEIYTGSVARYDQVITMYKAYPRVSFEPLSLNPLDDTAVSYDFSVEENDEVGVYTRLGNIFWED